MIKLLTDLSKDLINKLLIVKIPVVSSTDFNELSF